MIEKITRRSDRRNFKNKPLAAYTAKDWFSFFSEIYERTYGEELCEKDANNIGQITLFSKFALVEVFGKRNWSVEDFKNFIEEQFIEYGKDGYKFGLYSFRSKKCKKNLDSFEDKIQNEKETNKLKKITHHKHYPIKPSEKNDLFDILSYLDDEYIKMIYTYGLPITHKYIQYTKNKTFSESSALVKKIIREDIVIGNKNHFNLVKNYLHTTMENSILWGPYYSAEEIKELIEPNKFIYDWKTDLDVVWEYFGLNESEIWEETEKNIYWKRIPQVEFFFKKELKEIKKAKKRK